MVETHPLDRSIIRNSGTYPALDYLRRKGVRLDPVTRSSDQRQPGEKILGEKVA